MNRELGQVNNRYICRNVVFPMFRKIPFHHSVIKYLLIVRVGIGELQNRDWVGMPTDNVD